MVITVVIIHLWIYKNDATNRETGVFKQYVAEDSVCAKRWKSSDREEHTVNLLQSWLSPYAYLMSGTKTSAVSSKQMCES